MRVLIERTCLTDLEGKHVPDLIRERFFLDANDLRAAIGNFADKTGTRVLESVSLVSDNRAIVTAREPDGRLCMIAAELADDFA